MNHPTRRLLLAAMPKRHVGATPQRAAARTHSGRPSTALPK